ncbi:MAG: FeoC-like transcriptional regulator [Sphaerochaeta sp.]|jgi:predicted HTH transcriptional regulator|nr:FeoC-like transcriptional regulator [Sphaerochaeta sp.]MDX9915782.1 FeoC-like transcriptional regulator [Sphaerochaeta sp.]
MLKELLAHINGDGYFSKPLLARTLNISEAMVDQGLAQLLRMGYMKEEVSGGDCTASCSGCAFAAFCHKDLVKMYQLTDRGKALLAS